MTKLKRWVDDSPPSAVLDLLQAARTEKAPSRVVSRTLVAFGTTSAASGVAAASGGAATASKLAPSIAAIVIKWGGAGLLGGSVVVGAVSAVNHHTSSSGVTHASRANLSPPSGVAGNPRPDLPRAPAAAAVESVAAPSRPNAPPVTEPRVKPGASSSHHDEASALDAESSLIGLAHARLRAGDGASVLELLSGYEERFSPPRFEPEVLYLRMQSAVASGDRANARRFAALIVKRFPTSPGVGHAEALLRAAGGAQGQ